MITPLKVALGATAATVVLAAGFAVLGRPDSQVGGIAPPTASPSPTSPPTQPPAPSPVPAAGAIAPGTYHLSNPLWSTVDYELTVPGGWIAENGGETLSKHPDEPGGLMVNPYVVDRIFADPCGNEESLAVGPSAADLAAALMTQPGPRKAETAVTLGGHPATLIELRFPPGLDAATCDPPIGLQIWQTTVASSYLVLGDDATLRVYIADVDGRRFVIVAGSRSASPASDIAELTAIIDSIRFVTE